MKNNHPLHESTARTVLEQHRDVERAERWLRVVVFSAIAFVTLALLLIGLVLWFVSTAPHQHSREVRSAPCVPGQHFLAARRQPATPTRRGEATSAWAELEVDPAPFSSRLVACWTRTARGRRTDHPLRAAGAAHAGVGAVDVEGTPAGRDMCSASRAQSTTCVSAACRAQPPKESASKGTRCGVCSTWPVAQLVERAAVHGRDGGSSPPRSAGWSTRRTEVMQHAAASAKAEPCSSTRGGLSRDEHKCARRSMMRAQHVAARRVAMALAKVTHSESSSRWGRRHGAVRGSRHDSLPGGVA